MNTSALLLNQVPALGFGTYGLKGKSCVNSINDAIAAGYRHIDTARMYENESEVGEGIRINGIDREKLFVVTKIAPAELIPSEVDSVTDNSLKNLRTDYIDLLLIHWPIDGLDLKGILEKMMFLKEKGKIRNIGVSNFSTALVNEALRHASIMTNQVEFNPFHLQKQLLKQAKENNFFITAYTPLAKGKIFGNKIITEIASLYKKNEVQITLRWLFQHGNVAVIPKAESAEHRKSNMEIFDFELTHEEMSALSNL